MALGKNVVDVPVGSLNQTPPEHSGPTGRMTEVLDVVFNRHTGEGDGKRVRLDPRPGFTSLSDVAHSSETGVTGAAVFASPNFLEPLGDQLLSINTNQPKVFDGDDWTNYGERRIVTQKLSQSVLHAANATIAAPDHAWIAGVTCGVWTEQTYVTDDDETTLNTTAYVGFRSDNGAWIRSPSELNSAVGEDDNYQLAKVVSDGSRFWVFYNTHSGGDNIAADVFDLNGVLLDHLEVPRVWPISPGYWDVVRAPGENSVILAQPNAVPVDPGDDLGVRLTKYEFSGTISTDSNDIAAHCMGPVAWLTNDLTGDVVYLGTCGPTEPPGTRLWAYEIDSNNLSITHEYDVSVFPTAMPDSLTGWAVESGVTDERDVYLSYSMLAVEQLSGPTYDPQTRTTLTVKRTFAGVTTTIRQTNAVILQSRAFAINSEYYAYTYYQSGSGQALPSAIEDHECEEGDYFIGAPVQPITIVPGSDGTTGSPKSFTGQFTTRTDEYSAENIDDTGTADSVEVTTVGAAGLVAGGFPILPPDTIILKWTFKNLTVSPPSPLFGFLAVDGSSIPTANFDWWIITAANGDGSVYTEFINKNGGTVIPGDFVGSGGAGGTVEITSNMRYQVPQIGTQFDPQTKGVLFAGEITVSGDPVSSVNGTFDPIIRVDINPFPGNGISEYYQVIVETTTQASGSAGPNSITLTPAQPRQWGFTDLFASAVLHDFPHTLVIGDNPFVVVNQFNGVETAHNNQGEYTILDAPSGTQIVTSGDSITAHTFATVVEASIRAPLGMQYTLHVDGIDFDYTYIGALLTIDDSGPRTNGVYKIVDIIDADTVRLEPTDGSTGHQSADLFGANIFIQRSTNVVPQTQPTWFVTPLTGSQPQVGCFEGGLAYADWRFDGEATASEINRYAFALSSTSNPFSAIRQVMLPYRVANFTQVSIATVGQTQLDIANLSTASTVGLKVFQSTGRGEGAGDAGKLLVPGLLATEFTASGFAENNFNVGPEAPFLFTQEEDTDTSFALTPGATYVIQVTVAVTLENGDLVESKPSPPLTFTLTGANNVATYGGRLLMPLGVDGLPVADHYGVTNHRKVVYKIFRTVIVNGVPSTQVHLITNPANPNGLYGGTGTGSGFTFPNEFTWNYRDSNPDAGIQGTEVLYAGSLGQGIAPHFPCPAFKHATTWNGRRWVVGYDGAVWMSAELIEGEDAWFFPGFRYAFPPEDQAVAVVGFGSFLYMLCQHSVWWIGTTQLPNATLTAGQMPPPVKMEIEMGCTGFAVACSDFLAFSSSTNEGRDLWAITRDRATVFLSEPISEGINQPISGLEFDGKQRLIMLAGDSRIRVFDTIAKEWSAWRPPSVPDLITIYQGQPTYNDSAFVLQQQDNAIVDTRDAAETTVAIDATFASLSFAAVRAVKRLWEVQIIGVVNGACNINATISYPDDNPTDVAEVTTFGPTLLDTAGSMLLAINPSIEDAATFDIRIWGSYGGILVPGRCFSLEMLSCEVGVDQGQGVRKLPDAKRIVGSTS
jgi:hypothetical protein